MKPRSWEQPPRERVLLGVCVALERRNRIDRGLLRAAFTIPCLLGLVGGIYAVTHCGPCTADRWTGPALVLTGIGAATALVYIVCHLMLRKFETPVPPPTDPR